MESAIKKLKGELKAATEAGSAKAKAVAPAVFEALSVFCGQQAEFAQAVEQSGKTLGEVCEACVKNVGSSVSDLEVYRRAVAEYFPGAQVDCVMTVRMSGYETNPSRDPETPKSRTSGEKDVLSLDLFDLMG